MRFAKGIFKGDNSMPFLIKLGSYSNAPKPVLVSKLTAPTSCCLKLTLITSITIQVYPLHLTFSALKLSAAAYLAAGQAGLVIFAVLVGKGPNGLLNLMPQE